LPFDKTMPNSVCQINARVYFKENNGRTVICAKEDDQ
jgi:hypothetical protein